MRDFFEEVAKHRAARRVWSDADPGAVRQPRIRARCQLRLFSGGDGTTLTAVEPQNNIVRIT